MFSKARIQTLNYTQCDIPGLEKDRYTNFSSRAVDL